MFVIKPKDAADWQYAVLMLSYYMVKMEAFSDGDNMDSVYMIVRKCGRADDQLRLAEMAFQMNWHQAGSLCPHCSDDLDSCGHLTFHKPINPAF